MICYEAEGFGDSKLLLKEQIGEIVRRVFRRNNPERFYNLTYKIIKHKETENLDKGKYKIEVQIYETEAKDSKFPLIAFKGFFTKWKYHLAIRHNYLNILDRIRLHGIFPEPSVRKVKV